MNTVRLRLSSIRQKKRGILVGAAVECSNSTGYGGEIRIIVGFEADGTIRDYRVLKHQETPGLGAKMDEWFRTEKNNQNIIGKSPIRNKLQVKQDSGDIDAITAATITSRAFFWRLYKPPIRLMPNP